MNEQTPADANRSGAGGRAPTDRAETFPGLPELGLRGLAKPRPHTGHEGNDGEGDDEEDSVRGEEVHAGVEGVGPPKGAFADPTEGGEEGETGAEEAGWGRSGLRLSRTSHGTVRATTQSCMSSMPRLKASRAAAKCQPSSWNSANTLAKARPCTRPKPAATRGFATREDWPERVQSGDQNRNGDEHLDGVGSADAANRRLRPAALPNDRR